MKRKRTHGEKPYRDVYDWLMFTVGLFGIIGVVVTIAITLSQSADNSADTAKAISQMAAIAKAMRDEKPILAQQANATDAALGSAKASADAAASQARTADKSLRQSERPYITIVPNMFLKGVDPSLNVDAAGNGTVTFVNSGHVPTVSASMIAGVRSEAPEKRFAIARSDLRSVPISKSISVGNTSTVFVANHSTSPPWIGKNRAYLFGKITYADSFGVWHHTKFCYWFASPGGTETACGQYDESD